MSLLKALVRLASPMRFFAYLQLRQDRRSYCYTLSKVTSLKSVQSLHDKIRAIDEKIADMYFPNTK